MAAARGALSLLSTPNVTADGSIFVRLLNTPHGSAYLGCSTDPVSGGVK